MRQTMFEKLEKMVLILDKLAKNFGYEPEQIVIKVFEGLRDLTTQEMLFNNKDAEIRTANLGMSEAEVLSETAKWVSPVINNVPVHSTGGAVDIRLWDAKNHQFLDMSPFGVIWGKNTQAPTYSDTLTPVEQNNRLFMLLAATEAGLINYPFEYWHYSSGDRYASFWLEKDSSLRKAIYGSIS